MTNSGQFIVLICILISGTGVIAMGVWRVGGAVFRLASKVDLLAYRIEQIERVQAATFVPARKTAG